MCAVGVITSSAGASKHQSLLLGTYKKLQTLINGRVAYQQDNWVHTNQNLYWVNGGGGIWVVRQIIRSFLYMHILNKVTWKNNIRRVRNNHFSLGGTNSRGR